MSAETGKPFVVCSDDGFACFRSFGAAEAYAHEIARKRRSRCQNEIRISNDGHVWAFVNVDALDRVWTDFQPPGAVLPATLAPKRAHG